MVELLANNKSKYWNQSSTWLKLHRGGTALVTSKQTFKFIRTLQSTRVSSSLHLLEKMHLWFYLFWGLFTNHVDTLRGVWFNFPKKFMDDVYTEEGQSGLNSLKNCVRSLWLPCPHKSYCNNYFHIMHIAHGLGCSYCVGGWQHFHWHQAGSVSHNLDIAKQILGKGPLWGFTLRSYRPAFRGTWW